MKGVNINMYEVHLERDTSQEITISVSARNKEEAAEKALDLANLEDTEWQESQYLGDTRVVLINDTNAGQDEFQEVFNITSAPPSTNLEVVTDIMTYSNYGALAQLFVMDALTKFSKIVMSTPSEDMAMMDNGLISCEAWKGIAAEIHKKLSGYHGE